MRELYRKTVEYLLHWYDYNRRILPWRENPQPYYVWVSEIMLQQTRVEAVKDYFDRFLTALPTIEALAKAPEEVLLKLWEGLGYYNRVRNMQKAAQVLVEEYDGALPADYEVLKKLPGIGSYTAGAIASIAFQIPEPAVDGNVLRVMKRISGSMDDITKTSVKKELEEDIRAILPKERPGDYNQALMELGAMVCIPNGKPLCEACPVQHLCRAFKEETQALIPVKPPKKERKKEERAVLLVQYQDSFVLHKRADTGLLAGLWELPNFLTGKGREALPETSEASLKQNRTLLLKDGAEENEQRYICTKLEELFLEQGVSVHCQPIKKAKHIFSHIEWYMTGYCVSVEENSRKVLPKQVAAVMQALQKEAKSDSEAYVLAEKTELEEKYPLPSAFEVYRKLLVQPEKD